MNTSPYEDYKSAVLDLFGKRPRGVSAADVAKHIGLSRDQTLFWLRKMRKEGLAEPTPCGHVALWSTPGRCKVLTKIAEQARRKARCGRIERAKALDAWAWARTQRIVSASQAKPLSCTAPISVFHLAASMS